MSETSDPGCAEARSRAPRLVHAPALRNFAGAADFRRVSAGPARTANVCRARLRIFRLSPRPFSAGMFPARRTAVLESLQQLRRAVPRAMEHHAALSAVADLSAAAAAHGRWVFSACCICGSRASACFSSRADGRAFAAPKCRLFLMDTTLGLFRTDCLTRKLRPRRRETTSRRRSRAWHFRSTA